METDILIHLIAQIIYDRKGVNTLALDVKDISSITDTIIIAEGNVDRHVKAIASSIVEELKKQGRQVLHVEGMEWGDWIVLDYGDVMVHLFMPGLREKYQLEKLWQSGKIINLKIDMGQKNL